MDADQVQQQISQLVVEIMSNKGLEEPNLGSETLLLGGDLEIDSLDLATIVVNLSEHCNKDPFSDGFIEFRTVSELARLYAD